MDKYEKYNMRVLKDLAAKDPYQAAIYYSKMGEIAAEHGMKKEAEKYYKKSLEIRLNLSEKIKTAENGNNIAIRYDDLGGLARQAGRYEEALEYYQKGLEVRLDLAGRGMISKDDRGLTVSYNRLAGVSNYMRRHADTIKYLEMMLDNCLARTKKFRTEQDYYDLQAGYYSMGRVLLENLNKPDEAKPMFECAIRLYEEHDYPRLAELASSSRVMLRTLNSGSRW